ncbi:MAG: hypothetical protein HUK22_05430, partial [Thermoguttaceae bacterium]|nr:hypothetical protein [Thermoguttaceae bacterium]
SYVKPDEDIALSSFTATMANEFCEVVLAGLTIVPAAIMFLGAAALADKLDSSFAMGFIALPSVFGLMPGGQIFGFIFFSLLFLAGMTSSISQVQPVVAFIEEATRWGKGRCAAATAAVCAVGTAAVCWFTRDLAALDNFDFWAAQFMPFIFAFIQTALVVFVWGVPNYLAELDRGAKMRVPRFIGALTKYVSLPYLAAIFFFWAYQNIGDYAARIVTNPIAGGSFFFIVLLIVASVLMAYRVARRWDAEEAAAQGAAGETGK